MLASMNVSLRVSFAPIARESNGDLLPIYEYYEVIADNLDAIARLKQIIVNSKQ